jgi:hypothetical protein
LQLTLNSSAKGRQPLKPPIRPATQKLTESAYQPPRRDYLLEALPGRCYKIFESEGAGALLGCGPETWIHRLMRGLWTNGSYQHFCFRFAGTGGCMKLLAPAAAGCEGTVAFADIHISSGIGFRRKLGKYHCDRARRWHLNVRGCLEVNDAQVAYLQNAIWWKPRGSSRRLPQPGRSLPQRPPW